MWYAEPCIETMVYAFFYTNDGIRNLVWRWWFTNHFYKRWYTERCINMFVPSASMHLLPLLYNVCVERLLARLGTHIAINWNVLTDDCCQHLCMQNMQLNWTRLSIGITGYRISACVVVTIIWHISWVEKCISYTRVRLWPRFSQLNWTNTTYM